MLKYQYLVLGNNDILLPNGAITALQELLHSGVSIAVPLTSEKGAGHNPSQSLLRALNKTNLESYVNNPYNVQNIQDSLTGHAKGKTGKD
jgi:hypothetical protein